MSISKIGLTITRRYAFTTVLVCLIIFGMEEGLDIREVFFVISFGVLPIEHILILRKWQQGGDRYRQPSVGSNVAKVRQVIHSLSWVSPLHVG